MSTKSILFAMGFFKDCYWLLKCPLWILIVCSINLQTEVSDRAGFVQVIQILDCWYDLGYKDQGQINVILCDI